MKLLVVTNLYPPQELGGYGRAISDFVRGLAHRGHYLQVICHDAPYLGSSTSVGPCGERVSRTLKLKGSYYRGVHITDDPLACIAVDQHNAAIIRSLANAKWDGLLLGNIDLIGPEILPALLHLKIPIVHHIGFIEPPFSSELMPQDINYHLVASSHAVKNSLQASGFFLPNIPVIYPGARTDLFGVPVPFFPTAIDTALALSEAGYPLGSSANPFKVGFAGLLMGSKGLHTLILALIKLSSNGVTIQANIAGSVFQEGYKDHLDTLLQQAGLTEVVSFLGPLSQTQLSRFWPLHHVGVFPSIYPEAFGIVGAEIMASGVALVTSGVGGSSELIEDGLSGLKFEPNNPASLAAALEELIHDLRTLSMISKAGKLRCQALFGTDRSSQLIENLIIDSEFNSRE